MQKQAPTVGRLLVMVLFALSCFGLLLFLWLSFGGAIPLKPQGYRFKVAVPDAAQLGIEADVRVAGIKVGRVVKKDLYSQGNATLATVELDPRFAPLHANAQAILRQKTLLGETYLELTPGTKGAPFVPDGGSLDTAQVKQAVTLDQIFNALDPQTRHAFRTWQQSLAPAIQGHGTDFNNALGNLPEFAQSATDLLTVLDDQHSALRNLVFNTGTVFNALDRNEAQLHNLITGSSRTFSATAAQNNSLAETFRIFPTFLNESKSTLARVRTFALNTDPLIQDLKPATADLGPTLRSAGLLAPDLKRLFINLDPLISAAKTGLPALRDTLNGATPLLAQIDPFLQQFNPILQWIEYNQALTSNFIGPGIGGVAATEPTQTPGGVGHYLRQFGVMGSQTLSLSTSRTPDIRSNPYPFGTSLGGPVFAQHLIFPNFDCNTAGGDKLPTPGPQGTPGCYVAPLPPGFQALPSRTGGNLPSITPDNYDNGASTRLP